jgi:hypothetical protein
MPEARLFRYSLEKKCFKPSVLKKYLKISVLQQHNWNQFRAISKMVKNLGELPKDPPPWFSDVKPISWRDAPADKVPYGSFRFHTNPGKYVYPLIEGKTIKILSTDDRLKAKRQTQSVFDFRHNNLKKRPRGFFAVRWRLFQLLELFTFKLIEKGKSNRYLWRLAQQIRKLLLEKRFTKVYILLKKYKLVGRKRRTRPIGYSILVHQRPFDYVKRKSTRIGLNLRLRPVSSPSFYSGDSSFSLSETVSSEFSGSDDFLDFI